MLDIKWIRDNPDALDAALRHRGAAPAAERLIALDETRRTHIAKLQEAQELRNAASKEIGRAKAGGDEATAQHLIAKVAEWKAFLQTAEERGRDNEKALETALALIPNVPLPDVPVGPNETANVEYKRFGEPRRYAFQPKEHFELGEQLRLMDFDTAGRLSGARFVILLGQLARLERALGQFMLDLHTGEHGYTEVQPPLMVRDEVMFGTAQLPKFEDDQFYVHSLGIKKIVNEAVLNQVALPTESADLNALFRLGKVQDAIEVEAIKGRRWLIPTAEVPLTNLVREAILEEANLPLRFTALTPCFRSEAGAAGRDTRGMLRQHQFDKVELVSITTPEQSRAEHERMLNSAEAVLQRLELPYRVMTLSTGDMGFASQKTWDIEVWLPGQGTYREISSCSVCGDFQARRMQARYRPTDGKGTRLVHTLNGSGVAVGRALIAVLETYQNEDGSITIPTALRPYMGDAERIGG
ncbi:MAG: serine--tRNA ligase [Bauldia sp.]